MERRKGRVGTVALVFIFLLGLVMILAACEDPLGADDDNGNDNGNGITDPIDDDDVNGDDNGDVVERSLTLNGTIAGSVPYDDEAESTFDELDASFVANGMEIEVYEMPTDSQLGDLVGLTSNGFDLTITVPDTWEQTFEEFLAGYGITDPAATGLDFGDADLSSILVMQAVLDLVSDESEWALVNGKTVTGESTVEFYDYWWVDQEITIHGTEGDYEFDNVTLSPGWNHVPTIWDAADDSYSRSATENTIDGVQWIAVDEDDDNDA